LCFALKDTSSPLALKQQALKSSKIPKQEEADIWYYEQANQKHSITLSGKDRRQKFITARRFSI
jgi:hypothetical protein